MPRAPRLPPLLVALAGCVVLSVHAEARSIGPYGPHELVFEVPLPGGVQAALDVVDDPRTADRSHFLVDLIRRYHHTARGREPQDEAGLEALVAHVNTAGARAADTIPLPLPPTLWIEAVFGGRAAEDTLLIEILRSRDAALLYYGLLALDGETRAWLADRPALITDIVSRSAPLFATAAPGFRVTNGAVRLPGGRAAEPAWTALVGRPLDEPDAFLRAMLGPGQGRLTYFVAAMAQLTDAQRALAMGLDASDPAAAVATTRRLFAIFERLGWDWKVEERVFWRPALDPALLVAELAPDTAGRPLLAGTEAFWRLAFADARRGMMRRTSEADARAAASGPPADFVWVCEQIFDGATVGPEYRYRLALFASRVVREVTPDTARDAIDAVRTAAAYPSLSTALERAGITDAAVFAAAGHRAASLGAIGSRTRATRAIAQFQGALVLLTREAARSTAARQSVAQAVASLASVEPGARGDYEGRLVRWLDAHLRARAPAPRDRLADDASGVLSLDDSLDGRLRRGLAGAFDAPPRLVDWEGTRYRVDLAHAELIRIDQVLGPGARPYASAALALVHLADAIETVRGADALSAHADELDRIARSIGADDRASGQVEAFGRRARKSDARGAARLALELRVAADDLIARGLVEFVYAAAFGLPARTAITAREAAARHEFGIGARDWRHNAPWQVPVEKNDPDGGWRISGSLLGLDVRLAPFSLLQLSSTPPRRRPTLNDQDRRTMIETVALVAPAALADEDRDAIVRAMRRGRARLAALRAPGDARTLADDVRMSPARRSLLGWALTHDPDAVLRFLSAGELLWAGLDAGDADARLHAWGAPARPRLGCLCLRVIDPRPDEMVSGRWHSGVRVSAFPDLNLRLAELLAELGMPAALLAPVLAPAILDFVNLVVSRDPDDRRGLVEFVQTLRIDQVEQYLAALTTDGPLVPLGEAPDEPSAASDGSGSQVPW